MASPGPRPAPGCSVTRPGCSAAVTGCPLAALIAGLAVIYYWQVASAPQDAEEIELLAGELPLNAYLDQGFDQWLSDSSRQ